jgi:thiol-disulfide isomerase/thioredoxin
MTRWIVSAVALLVVAGGGWLVMNPVATAEEEAAPHPHEYSPVVKVDLTAEVAGAGGDYLVPWDVLRRDFSGTSRGGEAIDLEEVVSRNRVTLLTYFAEWCANCRYEAPDLVAKYNARKADGLMVIGRSEYSHPDVVAEYVDEFGIEYPVILGSPNPDPDNEDLVRTTTSHFRMRKALLDPRKWGTPLNIVVVDGDPTQASVVTGEFFPGAFDKTFVGYLDGSMPAAEEASGMDR